MTASWPADAARAVTPARASVSAGGVDTEYRRCGRGPALVLLAEGADDAWTDGVMGALARDFLVLAPRRPAGVRFADWLADFLDGLGVVRASIVAEPSQLAPALAFAESAATRVGRVALLVRGTEESAPLTTFFAHGG